jgi:cytidyltransferase-like protein
VDEIEKTLKLMKETILEEDTTKADQLFDIISGFTEQPETIESLRI